MANPAPIVAAPAPAQRNAQQQQPQQQGVGQILMGMIRMALFWYLASQMFGFKKQPADPATSSINLFSKGEKLDMWFYLSEDHKFADFGNEQALVWHETNVPYAAWTPDSSRHHVLTYSPSEAVMKHNGTVYGHVFFTRSGFSPNPSDPDYDHFSSFSRTVSLISYLPKPKTDKRKSLLEAKDEAPEVLPEVVEDEGITEWVSFWKPNVTMNLVDDFTKYSRNALPPTVAEYLNFEETSGNYYPTVFFNEFWLLRDKLIRINETTTELTLNLDLSPISLTRWQLYLQIDQSFQIHRSYGSMLEGEADELKRVFLEGNPILLAITMTVSLLHTVFDFLAFKNDIQFWNKNKSMEGLSARSVVVNFFCQLVVFLYLLDNETSWMIILSSGVGCCIEFWKIGKAMHIEVDRSGRFPLLRFRDRDSYAKNKTKEYDDLAMRYLSYVLYPVVLGFAIYSLIYDRHKSWYSWILSSLTSCVYTFGFIMMCPQLFINYKLKSVAHLPWRQMTYKFLNTIIDDLFAFVIKMPILHRLSVFRDDIIFLIYLYQRWIYPVDRKRINEFGFGGEDASDVTATTTTTPDAAEAIDGDAPATSIPEQQHHNEDLRQRHHNSRQETSKSGANSSSSSSDDDDDDASTTEENKTKTT
ncbi:cleft lip and palate transmembrane protein 1 homolog [Selaginella moellendorffii]|nr:cleft lip and palate transmembrane protein 1 homolog [Selaginella moellendorffii]|eukprot:XP_002970129.2 cleft lip and palate transmembrane protein 1 homolog [Selaginella moellendorffii]